LDHSENIFDQINIINNKKNTLKFKDISSSNSINTKKTIFEDDIGSSNNLFESTNSQTNNFFENLAGFSNKNPNVLNNTENINNTSSNLNLGSSKTLENQKILITNPNSEKDILNNTKNIENIDFNINNNHENKSSNTNSDNNQVNSNEDNLSIPEIYCKSIELIESNNEKKHSTNSSNLNNQSNGNYQETKEFNDEVGNMFLTNFKEENLNLNKNIKKVSNKDKSVKNIIEISDNLCNNESIFYNNETKKIENDHSEENKEYEKCHSNIDRINLLENEICNLRKIVNNYKKKEIELGESMLKLEISNLNNSLKSKHYENQLLTNENNNLKYHIKLLQENFQRFFDKNSLDKDSVDYNNKVLSEDCAKDITKNEDFSKNLSIDKTDFLKEYCKRSKKFNP